MRVNVLRKVIEKQQQEINMFKQSHYTQQEINKNFDNRLKILEQKYLSESETLEAIPLIATPVYKADLFNCITSHFDIFQNLPDELLMGKKYEYFHLLDAFYLRPEYLRQLVHKAGKFVCCESDFLRFYNGINMEHLKIFYVAIQKMLAKSSK